MTNRNKFTCSDANLNKLWDRQESSAAEVGNTQGGRACEMTPLGISLDFNDLVTLNALKIGHLVDEAAQ